MGIRSFSLGVNRPGRKADHSLPSSAAVKEWVSYNSIPQCAFMAWCLVKHRDNFTFYLYLLNNIRVEHPFWKVSFFWYRLLNWRHAPVIPCCGVLHTSAYVISCIAFFVWLVLREISLGQYCFDLSIRLTALITIINPGSCLPKRRSVYQYRGKQSGWWQPNYVTSQYKLHNKCMLFPVIIPFILCNNWFRILVSNTNKPKDF